MARSAYSAFFEGDRMNSYYDPIADAVKVRDLEGVIDKILNLYPHMRDERLDLEGCKTVVAHTMGGPDKTGSSAFEDMVMRLYKRIGKPETPAPPMPSHFGSW
jgi:hypothetical protein